MQNYFKVGNINDLSLAQSIYLAILMHKSRTDIYTIDEEGIVFKDIVLGMVRNKFINRRVAKLALDEYNLNYEKWDNLFQYQSGGFYDKFIDSILQTLTLSISKNKLYSNNKFDIITYLDNKKNKDALDIILAALDSANARYASIYVENNNKVEASFTYDTRIAKIIKEQPIITVDHILRPFLYSELVNLSSPIPNDLLTKNMQRLFIAQDISEELLLPLLLRNFMNFKGNDKQLRELTQAQRSSTDQIRSIMINFRVLDDMILSKISYQSLDAFEKLGIKYKYTNAIRHFVAPQQSIVNILRALPNKGRYTNKSYIIKSINKQSLSIIDSKEVISNISSSQPEFIINSILDSKSIGLSKLYYIIDKNNLVMFNKKMIIMIWIGNTLNDMEQNTISSTKIYEALQYISKSGVSKLVISNVG